MQRPTEYREPKSVARTVANQAIEQYLKSGGTVTVCRPTRSK